MLFHVDVIRLHFTNFSWFFSFYTNELSTAEFVIWRIVLNTTFLRNLHMELSVLQSLIGFNFSTISSSKQGSFKFIRVVVSKWYFVTKIVLTWEKNCSIDREKPFEIRGWRPRICEITRKICSNSERSEQFLVTECFFNLFL